MKIVLIRHGATAGNIKKRYIGITDEDLCASGIESIHNNIKAGYYQEVRFSIRFVKWIGFQGP